MKYKNFRDFRIRRTCDKKYKTCEPYRKYLQKDFKHRCAYCNTLDFIVKPLSYHIEHYIPRDTFKKKKPELETSYNNLMYACPKCNQKKGELFEGDNELERLDNDLFYNPVNVDYNEIFYRDEYGTIGSNDEKGRNMITLLELYKPIYNIAWLLDEIIVTREEIKNKLEKLDDDNIRKELQEALNKINNYYIEVDTVFKNNYYNSTYKLKDL
ncbi:MAG: HNH endonuclease [Clostridia bacterium]|nr:HNH endonuclease [Clostridia bacterium]